MTQSSTPRPITRQRRRAGADTRHAEKMRSAAKCPGRVRAQAVRVVAAVVPETGTPPASTELLDFMDLFGDLHEILSTTGGVRIENCKSRALRRETWHIGRGEDRNAFVHLEVVLLETRQVKAALSAPRKPPRRLAPSRDG